MCIENITYCNWVTADCISNIRSFNLIDSLAFVNFRPIVLFIPSQVNVLFILARLASKAVK